MSNITKRIEITDGLYFQSINFLCDVIKVDLSMCKLFVTSNEKVAYIQYWNYNFLTPQSQFKRIVRVPIKITLTPPYGRRGQT